jgi:prolyl oligopeptidase
MPIQEGAIAAYPQAERLELREERHGRGVADPYRWLEDTGDPRTQEWSAGQDELFAACQARWLGGAAAAGLERRLAELAGAGTVTVGAWRGERRFFTRRGPGQEHEVLLAAGPDAAERVLVDPAAIDPSGLTTLDAWFPSPDGRRLAYLISAGGTERPALRVIDVATGELLDGPVDRVSAAPLAWLPGGEAFYYQRRPEPTSVPAGGGRGWGQVYLHRVGTDPGTDDLVFGDDQAAGGYPFAVVSPDGRWLWLAVDWGPVRVDGYVADLHRDGPGAPRFTAVQRDVDAKTLPTFGPDGRVYVLTDRDAPNRRVCVIDPERPGYEHWRTAVPEDPEAVLTGFAVLDGAPPGPRLVLAARSRHAVSELTLHDEATGATVARVAVPGLGSVKDLTAHPDGGPCAWFSYTDYVTPPTVYRFDARTREATVLARPPGGVAAGRVEIRQVTYASADETAVRMFILSPAGAPDPEPERPRPAILYGYGSFGSSRTPDFSPLRLAWVEAGGVYAIASVRGGGEEGEAWHRAGMRARKQAAVDDLHAAGDYLVDRGWTTRDRLGLHGGSAGGLLVGAALAQRPHAYAAVLCSAPILDMVRYERFQHAAGALEFGSAADPEEFGWLLAISPYHNVRPGPAYPATLFTVFEGDARVPTLHARKMAAALQHATSAAPADRPILLRREFGVGHIPRGVSRQIPLWLDQLAFFTAQLTPPEA